MRNIINTIASLEHQNQEKNIYESYQEDPEGSFTNDNKTYNLNKVLVKTEHLPTVLFFTRDLSWVLKYDNPMSDPQRVKSADLSAPILVGYYNNKFVVLDGIHRLQKALNEKNDTIIGKFVSESILASTEIHS